jgi:Family of unknown function (DUF6529)
MTRPATEQPTVPSVRPAGAQAGLGGQWPFPEPPHHPAPFPPGGRDSHRRASRRARRAQPGGAAAVLVAAGIGSLVAVGLGVYGRLHEPTSVAVNVAGFSSGLAAKSWLASAAFLLAIVQLWSAAAMYGRLGRRWRQSGAPGWVAALHRWSGRAAVLVTVPVAVHCLYALGYQDSTPRVLLHSLAGCFFYGVFVTKMLVLQRPDSPRWSLPLLGGTLFTALTAVWVSSAAWFFSTSGLSF